MNINEKIIKVSATGFLVPITFASTISVFGAVLVLDFNVTKLIF